MLLIFVTNDWFNDKKIRYDENNICRIQSQAQQYRYLYQYRLRIDCLEAEKDLKTTPESDCALNTLAIDELLEYARLYLDGNLQMWGDAEDSLEIFWFLNKYNSLNHY